MQSMTKFGVVKERKKADNIPQILILTSKSVLDLKDKESCSLNIPFSLFFTRCKFYKRQRS